MTAFHPDELAKLGEALGWDDDAWRNAEITYDSLLLIVAFAVGTEVLNPEVLLWSIDSRRSHVLLTVDYALGIRLCSEPIASAKLLPDGGERGRDALVAVLNNTQRQIDKLFAGYRHATR